MDQQNSNSKPDPIIIHRSNNVPLIAAIIFLALVIGAVGIYIGNNNGEVSGLEQRTIPTPPPSTQTQAPSPSPTLYQTEVLNWESYVSAKMKDLSFSGYSLSYPFEWSQKEEKNEITSTLTLTKDGNEIKIYQAPTGGNRCVFEGNLPEGPTNDYRGKPYIDIKIGDITLRRVQPDQGPGKITYSFCSNSETSQNSFGIPTVIGNITYTLAKNDPAILSEMDKILLTIKIQ